MASLSSWRERNTPRLRRFLVSFAKKLSTALSQEVDVGVKWKTNRAVRATIFAGDILRNAKEKPVHKVMSTLSVLFARELEQADIEAGIAYAAAAFWCGE